MYLFKQVIIQHYIYPPIIIYHSHTFHYFALTLIYSPFLPCTHHSKLSLSPALPCQGEENARKERMNQRIMKQYEDAIKKHKAGKPVDYEDLPTPPGKYRYQGGGYCAVLDLLSISISLMSPLHMFSSLSLVILFLCYTFRFCSDPCWWRR